MVSLYLRMKLEVKDIPILPFWPLVKGFKHSTDWLSIIVSLPVFLLLCSNNLNLSCVPLLAVSPYNPNPVLVDFNLLVTGPRMAAYAKGQK